MLLDWGNPSPDQSRLFCVPGGGTRILWDRGSRHALSRCQEPSAEEVTASEEGRRANEQKQPQCAGRWERVWAEKTPEQKNTPRFAVCPGQAGGSLIPSLTQRGSSSRMSFCRTGFPRSSLDCGHGEAAGQGKGVRPAGWKWEREAQATSQSQWRPLEGVTGACAGKAGGRRSTGLRVVPAWSLAQR